MSRYEFFTSLRKSIPNFFPEIKESQASDYVSINSESNKLIFAITFIMEPADGESGFNHSLFSSNFTKFREYLKLLGIIDLENLIKSKKDYDEKDPDLLIQETYFFSLSPEFALKLTD